MISLSIDSRPCEVPEGTTVLAAARTLGIAIPALCHAEGLPCQTSCLCCVVRIDGSPRLRPSCATLVQEGMRVEATSPEVLAAQRCALELLLGDHLGECLAPCATVCPAQVPVPEVLRLAKALDLSAALALVRQAHPFPAILGRICNAPCEAGCRRKPHDGSLAVQTVERALGDAALPPVPVAVPASGRRVAVVGAGPAGLAAAWFLTQAGHAVALYDRREAPGGGLLSVASDLLPAEVRDREIAAILAQGVRFNPGRELGRDLALDSLRQEHDAVLLALGSLDQGLAANLGLSSGRPLQAHGDCRIPALPGVFLASSALEPARQAVRSCAAGAAAARVIIAQLAGIVPAPAARPWVFRGLTAGEDRQRYLQRGADLPRRTDLDEPGALSGEAARCLACGCDKAASCRLRSCAATAGASQSRWRGGQLPPYHRDDSHPLVAFEPGKCIKCGLCVAECERRGETVGLALSGRGFDVHVAVPLGQGWATLGADAALACAKLCPTSAIYLKPPAAACRLPSGGR